MEVWKNIFVRIAAKVAALIVLSSVAAGCVGSKMNDISITSVDVESVTPSGLRGVNAVLSIGVDNPSVEFSLSDIGGTVYYQGKTIATFTADPVTVKARKAEVYNEACTVTLDKSVNFLALAELLRGGAYEDMTVDVTALATAKPGIHKKLEYKDMSVAEFIRKATSKKNNNQ